MLRREFIAGLGGTAARPIRTFGAHGRQETFGESHFEWHLVHALVLLLIAFGIFAATPTNAAQSIPETTSLFEASAAGDLSRVQTLLALKADVNSKQANGATSLMAASAQGQLEVVPSPNGWSSKIPRTGSVLESRAALEVPLGALPLGRRHVGRAGINRRSQWVY